MGFIRKSHLAKKYGVTPKTVDSWLGNAIAGKNNLQYADFNGINQILDTANNDLVMQKLTEDGRKHKGPSAYKKITPKPEFYEILDQKQLIELVTNLDTHKRIPMKFAYLSKGADTLNSFYLNDKDYNLGDQLLKQSFDFLRTNLESYDTINIVDIGPGNGLAIKQLIDMLYNEGFKLNYLGIDYSQRMLDIVTKNLNEWYPDLPVQTQIGDMEYLVLQERLFTQKLAKPNSCNLILFLGFTIGNVYDRHRVFQNFADSMTGSDYLVINNGLDNISGRNVFTTLENDFIIELISYIPEKLDLSENDFERINRFDEAIQSRVQILKLNKDIELEINFKQGKRVIQFKDGEEITIWNHYSHSTDNLFTEVRESGLDTSFLAQSPDKDDVLIICEPSLVS
jgi:uncharacterized SAM-dependent methyltransferase